MRAPLILCVCLLFCSLGSELSAQEVGVFRVPREARAVLGELGATVRHGSQGGSYTAELTPAHEAELRRRGFTPVQLFSSLNEEKVALGIEEAVPAGFTSYAVMRSDFYAYAAAHPSIAALEVLGTSVDGREIFALRISGNVLVEEDEPEIAFWGNIHGDEFASGEMPYRYAKHLCDNYGVDPTVTAFVDNNEIWCVPLLNPDGHEAGTRRNSNNVDLNRDYGFQWNAFGGSPAPMSQPETRVIFEFMEENNITLSSTFHCSGDVLFYPWGFSANTATDDTVIREIGFRYSNAAAYNLVNSWSDYETHGELVDTAYGAFGGLCFTTEISNVAGILDSTYSRNKAGMDAFFGQTYKGIHGLVTDAATGLPLRASVWVSGSDVPSYTDSTVGDLHRIVLPGTYSVTVWANGYLPQTVTGIAVTGGTRGEFQVALSRGNNEHAFFIPTVKQADPQNSYANKSQPSWALGPPDGKACSLGREGFIVLDLGEGHMITDGPDVDFTVTEASLVGDTFAEAYRVYAGDAYNQNTLIGTGIGTASFDIGAVGLSSVRYLKIEDRSGAAAGAPLGGFDLDSITVLSGTAGPSLTADVDQISLSAGGTQRLSLVAPTPGALYYLLLTETGSSPVRSSLARSCPCPLMAERCSI